MRLKFSTSLFFNHKILGAVNPANAMLAVSCDNFSLPTFILQWLNVGEKWEVLEYVMVDAENNTIIFVYTMSSLERIQSYTHYDVTPYDYDFLENNFSIYGKLEDGDSYIRNDTFDKSTYDISFIDNLK